MSIVYCDWCNHSAPKREWEGSIDDLMGAICSQCECDAMANAELEFDAADRIPFINWSN